MLIDSTNTQQQHKSLISKHLQQNHNIQLVKLLIIHNLS